MIRAFWRQLTDDTSITNHGGVVLVIVFILLELLTAYQWTR